jgi:hypothetical protein
LSTDLEIPGEGFIPEPPDASTELASSKLEWHCPTITRIDIKRTLFGAGTIADSTSFPQSAGT